MKIPLLVQMAGHGGSGKSTLARQIAELFGGVAIDLDVVKTALLDSGLDWAQASKASYATIYALVDDLLTARTRCVVVDTPSYWAEIHQRLVDCARTHEARYVFVECVASEVVRADRLASRLTKRSQIPRLGMTPTDAPADDPPIHTRPIVRPGTGPCLTVDTDTPADVAIVLQRINATFPELFKSPVRANRRLLGPRACISRTVVVPWPDVHRRQTLRVPSG